MEGELVAAVLTTKEFFLLQQIVQAGVWYALRLRSRLHPQHLKPSHRWPIDLQL